MNPENVDWMDPASVQAHLDTLAEFWKNAKQPHPRAYDEAPAEPSDPEGEWERRHRFAPFWKKD